MPVLLELNDVLARKKFDRYVPIEKRKEFLAALVKQVEFVEITEEITDCRDPADNKFLELAVCGGAHCIVSGDGDLADLHPFRGIRILSSHEFITQS